MKNIKMIYFLNTLILSNWSKWIPEKYVIDQDNEEYKKIKSRWFKFTYRFGKNTWIISKLSKLWFISS